MSHTVGDVAARVKAEGREVVSKLFGGDPVLVFRRQVGGSQQTLINTPPGGNPSANATDMIDLSATQADEGLNLAHIAGPDSLIVPITKSDRNPFLGVITVGRARNNDIRLASARASKLHAFIKKAGERWQISDNASSNGTQINNLELEPKVDHNLRSGDEVSFADLTGLFLDQEGLVSLCSLIGIGLGS